MLNLSLGTGGRIIYLETVYDTSSGELHSEGWRLHFPPQWGRSVKCHWWQTSLSKGSSCPHVGQCAQDRCCNSSSVPAWGKGFMRLLTINMPSFLEPHGMPFFLWKLCDSHKYSMHRCWPILTHAGYLKEYCPLLSQRNCSTFGYRITLHFNPCDSQVQ